MAFTKLSIEAAGADASCGSTTASEIDIWTIFRALRDARSVFGLRPGHIQTLQAMLSFLKPGHGETVFASNYSICQRVGGIDDGLDLDRPDRDPVHRRMAAVDDVHVRSPGGGQGASFSRP